MYFSPPCYTEETAPVGGGLAFKLLILCLSQLPYSSYPPQHPQLLSLHPTSVPPGLSSVAVPSSTMAAQMTAGASYGSDLVASLLGTCLNFSCVTAQ